LNYTNMNKKTKYYFLAVFVVFIWNQNVFSQTKNNPTPVPNERQLLWQEAELGVLISCDLHVFDGKEYIQKKKPHKSCS
jgi:hypothetical protein